MQLFGKRKTSIDLSKKPGTNFVVIGKSGLIVLLGAGLFFLALLTIHYAREVNALEAAQATHTPLPAVGTDPVSDAILAVGKHIMLPQGEKPQVAKVSNLAPLANIPFFGNALVGDEVLVYCKASLSILYSPARDQIIEVSREPVKGSCGR